MHRSSPAALHPRAPATRRRTVRAAVAATVALLPWTAACDSPAAEATQPQVVPAHTHDAADIVSGLIKDERLSSAIRLFDRDTVVFPGVVAWGGGPLLESSGLVMGPGALAERVDTLEASFGAFRDHHTHDADDVTSGTLPDRRLTGNVALLSSPVTSFQGALAWGGGSILTSSSQAGGGGADAPSDFISQRNVFTQPQTVFHRLMVATLTGEPTEGSGTIGLRFERNRDTDLSPLGMSWTMSGAERWAMGLDQGAESHPDFVLLFNTGIGDIFRVANGAHFQMGAGVGPTPTENLLLLNDRPGSGNEDVLRLQSSGDASRWIEAVDLDRDGGVPFAVGRSGATGIGTDDPSDRGLMLDVAGRARAERFETVSDARLKTDVEPLGGVLERLAALRAVRFRWKESGASDVGVIAQELEAAFPELVEERDGVKSVNYSGLTAVLLAAVAELAERCEVGTGRSSP